MLAARKGSVRAGWAASQRGLAATARATVRLERASTRRQSGAAGARGQWREAAPLGLPKPS